MHLSLLAGLGVALLVGARPLASESNTDLARRTLSQCANNPVWMEFQDSPLQAQASAFCSAYIGQTVTELVTVYPTTTTTEPIVTVTDATVDITVTDSPLVVETVTSLSSSSAVVPVTVTSVIEDVVPVTDFKTTTDATAFTTSTDVITTSLTDATVTGTVTQYVLTTVEYTYSFVEDTKTVRVTIDDIAVTRTSTSAVQVTEYPIRRRDNLAQEGEEDEEEPDACPAPEPDCTLPEYLYSSWLDGVSTIPSSQLSSACSCLVVPATTTSTLFTTGPVATRTLSPSVFATATGSVTAVKPRTSSRVVLANTVIEETSLVLLSVTETIASPTIEYVHATASSSAVVTRVVTEDETARRTSTSTIPLTLALETFVTITPTTTTTIHGTYTTTTTTLVLETVPV